MSALRFPHVARVQVAVQLTASHSLVTPRKGALDGFLETLPFVVRCHLQRTCP